MENGPLAECAVYGVYDATYEPDTIRLKNEHYEIICAKNYLLNMVKRKITSSVILLLAAVLWCSGILISCGEQGGNSVKFFVVNKTNCLIDTLIIATRNAEAHSALYNLRPCDSIVTELNMEGITITDGDYSICLHYADSITVREVFGYYTNGIPLDKSIGIVILPDDIVYEYVSGEHF